MSNEAETPILDLIATMTEASVEASSLDPQSLMLARIAALIAVDAPPASYVLNLGVAGNVGLDGETVRGVFAAVAPIVGTARVASAAVNVGRALGFAELVAELELEEELAEEEDVDTNRSASTLTSYGEGGRDVSGTE
jgi:alkylhydroperoxidase/carboxymuconolactone decarboxylase family protein YurZ